MNYPASHPARTTKSEQASPSRASRILYISASSPVPSKLGPARRNFHILDQLTRFYDVSVLSLGTPMEAALFREEFGNRVSASRFVAAQCGPRRKFARKIWQTLTNRCDFVPALEPQLREQCAELTRQRSFDAIVLSSVLLGGLPLPYDVPIIGDSHNVDFDVLRRTAASADSWARRQYARLQWPATRDEERRSAHRVDLLLATSERDQQLFEEEFDVPHVAVVPNGVDLAEFAHSNERGKSDVILFSGLMSYYPNQQAVRWFLDRVFPLVLERVPTATFVVAGAAPPRWLIDRESARVRVTGRVPDMRPYLETASVFVAPLLIGGGTRVKILEAQAVGRPVVSTHAGAEGLGARHGESILIADDAEAFARQVTRALSEPALAARLVAGGRLHVTRHYDWNQIGERLGSLLQARIGLIPHAESLAS